MQHSDITWLKSNMATQAQGMGQEESCLSVYGLLSAARARCFSRWQAAEHRHNFEPQWRAADVACVATALQVRHYLDLPLPALSFQ